MTLAGWIIMIVSISLVSLFFFWSLFLVFTHKKSLEYLHSTLDEPPDIKENE